MTALRASLLCALALALGCNSTPTPANDAAMLDAASGPDAGTSDAGTGDAGGCSDITGAYVFTGSCSTAAETPIPLVCVEAQTAACGATVEYATFPPGSASGEVAGTVLSFAGCTLHAGAAATLHCMASAGGTCNGSGTRVVVPNATRYCCQPGQTPSGCGAGERCTIVSTDTSNANTLTACMPVGSLTEGAACTRMGGRVGADDCGDGLFCANTRQADLTTRVCQRLCEHQADCHAGENCLWLGPTPAAGVCTGTCTIGGTDCPTGTTCRSSGMLGAGTAALAFGDYCNQAGTGVLGGACTDNTDCGANLMCPLAGDSATLANTCRPTCDTAHPCATGTCTPLVGLPNPTGTGFCG